MGGLMNQSREGTPCIQDSVEDVLSDTTKLCRAAFLRVGSPGVVCEVPDS